MGTVSENKLYVKKMGYVSVEQPGPRFLLFLTMTTDEQKFYFWENWFPSILSSAEVLLERTAVYPSNSSQINSDHTQLLLILLPVYSVKAIKELAMTAEHLVSSSRL